MIDHRAIAIAAAAALGAWLLLRRAAPQPAPVADPGAPLPPAGPGDVSSWTDGLGLWSVMEQGYQAEAAASSARDANVRAFLYMIAWAEGAEREPDPYRVCYGYRHTIRELSDHPAITGEWKGEKLPDEMCRNAGYSPGCVSTAAGRYQLIRPTWERARKALGLPDFGPASQDAAAVWLLGQRGALDHIRSGDLTAAIAAARSEWASLPGNTAGQPQRATDDLVAVYTGAGGTIG